MDIKKLLSNTPLIYSGFRKDINVLRAIGVISVILFHFDFEYFKGGYVGVDIFFVISGYLITSIILREKLRDTFSFKMFYKRRMWRLLPALFFVIFITLFVSVFILSPMYLYDLSFSAISAVFSVSNFFFWDSVGYFDTSTSFKPLLHTWSLGVEEQFYLIWPLILVIFFSIVMRGYTVFLVFFVISVWLMYCSLDGVLFSFVFDASSTTFYLLPYRICEFSLGALLLYIRLLEKSFLSEMLSFIGILLLVVAIYGMSNSTLFGINNIVALLGVVLFLITKNTMTHYILENKYLLYIGLISYSLYLVHWPIFVFFNYYNPINFSLYYRISAIIIVICCGSLMYHFIENKYRYCYTSEQTNSYIKIALIVIFLAIILLSALILYTDGLKQRITQKQQDIYAYATKYDKDSIIKSVESKQKILLLGESHSTHYVNLLRTYFNEKGIEIVHKSVSGCIPVPNTFIVSSSNDYKFDNRQKQCLKFNNIDNLMNLINDNYDAIILSARWSLYLDDNSYTKEANASQFYLIDEESFTKNDITHKKSKEIFENNLHIFIEQINSKNIPILIMGQVPPMGYDLLDCITRPTYSQYQCKPYYNKEFVEDKLSYTNNVFSLLEQNYCNVKFINSFDLVCNNDDDFCPIYWNGIYLYRDDDHLNMRASSELVKMYQNELDEFYMLIK